MSQLHHISEKRNKESTQEVMYEMALEIVCGLGIIGFFTILGILFVTYVSNCSP